MSLVDVLGLIGVLFMIYCYGRGQWQRDYSKKLSYSVLNLIGAIFLIVSLFYSWNLPAFVSSTAWVLFSLYGTYRCVKYMYRPKITPVGETLQNAQSR